MIKVIQAVKESMFRPLNTAAISILGVFSVLWGIWVGNPFWSVFRQAEIFEVMAAVLPEWAWGSIAFVVGSIMIYGVKEQKYHALKNGALAGFYFWLFASISFFAGDWKNTGGLTLAMIALYCGYVALNLSTNKEYFLERE